MLPEGRNQAQRFPILFARQERLKAMERDAAVGQMSVDLKSANYLKINCRNSFQSSAQYARVRVCAQLCVRSQN